MFVGFHLAASRLNIAVFTLAVAIGAVLILATRRPDAYTVSRGLLVNAGPDTLHAIINTDTMIGKDCAVGLAQLKALGVGSLTQQRPRKLPRRD